MPNFVHPLSPAGTSSATGAARATYTAGAGSNATCDDAGDVGIDGAAAAGGDVTVRSTSPPRTTTPSNRGEHVRQRGRTSWSYGAASWPRTLQPAHPCSTYL